MKNLDLAYLKAAVKNGKSAVVVSDRKISDFSKKFPKIPIIDLLDYPVYGTKEEQEAFLDRITTKNPLFGMTNDAYVRKLKEEAMIVVYNPTKLPCLTRRMFDRYINQAYVIVAWAQKKPKRPSLAVRAAFASVHADTKFGSDCVCRFAEPLAPGFTEAVQHRIVWRGQEIWDEDIKWGAKSVECFKPKRYPLFFLHTLLLWIAIRLIERHEPVELRPRA